MACEFNKKIYPIHPSDETVQDIPAYKSALDLPETPDLAVIVLPTNLVIKCVEECGKKGIKHAIIVSAGFKEVGEDGINLEKELSATAAKYNIRFLGPNCIGVANSHHKLNTTFMQYEGKPGFIGMASQSGSFITQMFEYLNKFGLSFSSGFSVGNEANVDIVDCLKHLGACPETKVIALYIEAIRRGREFIETARSIIPHKPIVAYYVGGSEAGRKAGFSHTGALSGSDRLYDGVFKQSGVIRAYSIEELYDYCQVLGSCPEAGGNNVIIQTHSGGPGAVAADACDRAGLALSKLSDDTRNKLTQFVPDTGSLNNPIDITYSKNPLNFFFDIPAILLEDKNTNGILIYFIMPEQSIDRTLEMLNVSEADRDEQAAELMNGIAANILNIMKKANKPIVGFSFQTEDNRFINSLQESGVPVLRSPTRAAKALGALVQYSRHRKFTNSVRKTI